MRPLERWWFRLWEYRKYNTRPSRPHPLDAPFIWAAHLLAWAVAQHQRWYSRNTTKPPTGGFSHEENK